MLKFQSGPSRSRQYHLSVDGVEVGELTYSLSGRKVQVMLQGRSLSIELEGFLFPPTVFKEGDRLLATAQNRHVFSSRLEFTFEGKAYEAFPKRWKYGIFVIERDEEQVGVVRRSESKKKFGAEVDVPEDCPLELQVFLGWIALNHWATAESAAAAAGGGAAGA